jgi:hypothetical protein
MVSWCPGAPDLRKRCTAETQCIPNRWESWKPFWQPLSNQWFSWKPFWKPLPNQWESWKPLVHNEKVIKLIFFNDDLTASNFSVGLAAVSKTVSKKTIGSTTVANTFPTFPLVWDTLSFRRATFSEVRCTWAPENHWFYNGCQNGFQLFHGFETH